MRLVYFLITCFRPFCKFSGLSSENDLSKKRWKFEIVDMNSKDGEVGIAKLVDWNTESGVSSGICQGPLFKEAYEKQIANEYVDI